MTMGDDDDDDDEEVMTTWPQRTCLFHARCASLSGINARANSNASGPRAYACKSRFVIEDRTWTICFTVSPSCATAWIDTCARRCRCGAPEVSPLLLLLLAWRVAARPAPRRGSTSVPAASYHPPVRPEVVSCRPAASVAAPPHGRCVFCAASVTRAMDSVILAVGACRQSVASGDRTLATQQREPHHRTTTAAAR